MFVVLFIMIRGLLTYFDPISYICALTTLYDLIELLNS